MNCKNCGAVLGVSEKTCTYCGTLIIRKENDDLVRVAIDELREALTFSEEGFFYSREHRKAVDKIEELEKKIKNTKYFVIFGLFFLFVTVTFLIISIIKTASCDYISMWILGIVYSIFALIAVVCLLIRGVVFGPIYKKRLIKTKKEKERIIEKNNEMHDRPSMQRSKNLYMKYFPEMTMTPENLTYIIQVLENGRASSMKEALRCLDEYLHRKKMEKLAKDAVEVARSVATKIENI